MSSTKHKGVEDLVTFVINTAREQGINVAPQAEAHIVYHCGEVHQEEEVLKNEHDVALVVAALVAGGHEVAESKQHEAVMPYDVDEGYWMVLRGGMEPPGSDMTCIDIFTCRETTILAREQELTEALPALRNLLSAIGEL